MRNILSKVRNAFFPSDIKEADTKIQAEKVEIEKVQDETMTFDLNVSEVQGDLGIKLKTIAIEKNIIERHFLLQSVVSETYSLRNENEKYKKLCLKFSEIHLNEFEMILKSLSVEYEGFTPVVTTFQYYATLLTELEQYAKAIEVCEMAFSHKLNDGTKGGYKGRIKRIKNKMNVDELKAYDSQNSKVNYEKSSLIEENKHSEELNNVYSIGEIRQLIREVVREAKNTVKVDTGYLQRSIKGDWIEKDQMVLFSQADYGVKKGNSKLFEIATKRMPIDLKWKIILVGDNGTVNFETN